MFIFLDESGDLGFDWQKKNTFIANYRETDGASIMSLLTRKESILI